MATGETLTQGQTSRDPDITLMLQVRDDVTGAFAVLVQRYQDRLLGIMTHMTGRADEAEALAQEVFLRLHKARKGYRPGTKLSTQLFAIANIVALGHLKNRSRQAPSDPPAGAAPDADERVTAVREALAALDDDERMAILLSKFERMRYAEIAEALARPEPVIRSMLASARMSLREDLESHIRADLGKG